MRTRTYPQRPDTYTDTANATDTRAASRPRRRAVRAAVAAGALGAAAMIGTAAAAPASAATGISGWTQVTHYLEGTLGAGEGVTTVYPPGGSLPCSTAASPRSRQRLRRGLAATSATRTRRRATSSTTSRAACRSPTSKMFRVTTPSGSSYEYIHQLVSGEEYNNSFDAVSPDTQWMVAGEWDTMTHLQVYPTPVLNKQTPATGGWLALSGYIQLDHPVNDIQGCDFVNATKLICASDDGSKSLFPDSKPLLEVDLPHALNGADLTGHVTDLGPIPQTNSICSGTFEAEGVDYDVDTGILRVEIIQPSVCEAATTVYEYKAN